MIMLKKTRNKCLFCNKKLERRNNIYCNQSCFLNNLYKKYIKKWKENKIDGGIVKGNVSNYIRRYLFEKYKSKCDRCGWKKISKFTNKIPLEVEHIDGNHKNNKENNLILICPNCHSLTGTYRALNIGKGRTICNSNNKNKC